MIPRLFDSSPIPVLEQMVSFAEARHQVLAGNIANLDTPGYRTRDLSPQLFAERMKAALLERNRGASSERSAMDGRGAPLAEAGESLAGMLRHDESNVAIETQITEMAKNQMQHNLALSIMTSQFRLLQTAISERV